MNLMTLKIENYGSNTEEVSFTHTCTYIHKKREGKVTQKEKHQHIRKPTGNG